MSPLALLIAADLPLPRCEPWPTMQVLPIPVIARLESLTLSVRRLGARVRRNDILGALILYHAPEEAEALSRMIARYRTAPRRGISPLPAHPSQPLMLTLPGPIS